MCTENPPLLEVRDLRVSFFAGKAGEHEAVRGVSLALAENETLALVGESGSGKSVTALAMLGLLPRESAHTHAASRVLYRGRNLLGLDRRELLNVRGREIAMIFQEPMSSLNPVFTVGFQILEVLRKHLGLNRRQARRRAVELLDEVGIPEPWHKVHAYPHQLSGGQQQRAMIAMAIACEPRLLIADEPTTALDVTIQQQILELLSGLRQRHGMSMLFISHDLALVRQIADAVAVMREGRIREHGPAEQVFNRPRDPYTRALLLCRPRLDSKLHRLPVIEDFLTPALTPIIVKSEQAEPKEMRRDGFRDTVLEVRNLSKSFYTSTGLFGRCEFRAVKEVSFRLSRGQTLGIVGESGCGKTTLAMTIMRLQPATSGEVLLQGSNWLALPPEKALACRRRLQIVFQNPYASLNPRFSVGHLLIEPMLIHGIGADAPERKARACELLERVGLPQAAFFRYPHEFSGGQRQRIAIARCLTLKPEVLICDEAVSALDVSVQAQVLNLLRDLQDDFGMSYIFISHDLAVVRHMADEILVMQEGSIVEAANADELYARPRHAYTQQLLAAVPEIKTPGPLAS